MSYWRRTVFATCLLSLAVPALAVAQQAKPVVLAPHRAVYDLSLLSTDGSKGVESVEGRIAFTFGGDACEGYTLDFRQVTVLGSAETGRRMSDLRTTTFEDGDGRLFRFKSESRQGSGAPTVVDGVATRESGPWTLSLTKPKPETMSFVADAIAPTAHMRRVIDAARKGDRILTVPVFDGSDDGRKVYDTLTVIGAPITAAASEPPARQDGMNGLTRWPVTISYFAPGQGERTPAYKMTFELYENGVSAALKLDYERFAVKGELKQLDLLEKSACTR